MRYIVQPTADATRQQIGGKAAALASLQQADFPVPDWFALTPDAFDASLNAADRERLAAACSAGDDAAVTATLAHMTPSDAVLAELTRAVAALAPDGQPLAVRSSASDEDGGKHSFAGQLASYLNVAPGDVAARVADVWRSGFSARILAYRRTHGLATLPPAPAVLIQRMVAADVAGVAFSADPATGQRGVAVVSAVAGLGEALVSGASDADTATVNRLGAIERIQRTERRAGAGRWPATGDCGACPQVRAALRRPTGYRVGHRWRRGLPVAVATDHDARRAARSRWRIRPLG